MNNTDNKRELSPEQGEELFTLLKLRFEKNMPRHKNLERTKIQAKLGADPEKLWSLFEMEQAGGETDVIRFDEKTRNTFFVIVRWKVRKVAAAFAATARGVGVAKRT